MESQKKRKQDRKTYIEKHLRRIQSRGRGQIYGGDKRTQIREIFIKGKGWNPNCKCRDLAKAEKMTAFALQQEGKE